MVESGGEPAPSWTLGVDGHGTLLAFSWLPWPLDEIKSRRDGSRTGNHHFILKFAIFIQDPEKKLQYLIFLQGGRQRLLFDGLVLQEDGSVRGRYFFGTVRRRGRSEVRSFAES